MDFIEIIKSAYVSIFSNKLRSGLTMLGIIINVASVILVHVAGDSLNKTIDKAFSDSRNANSCIVSFVPTPQNKTAVMDSEGEYILPDNLYFSDIVVEKYCILFEGKVKPIYESEMKKSTVRSDKSQSVSQTEMLAVNEAYADVLDSDIIKGRFISADDMDKGANTAVISDITAENCFGSSDPIGQYIYIRDDEGIENQYVVTGVYDDENNNYQTAEVHKESIVSTVYICYSKFLMNYQDYILESNSQGFQLRNITDFDEFKHITTNFFESYFNEKDWTVDLFLMTDEVISIQKILELLTHVMNLITFISVIVGGIGIMNVMTVSVNERTQEIGIKKAIGARSSTIIIEFLVEAVILSVIAVFIGIVIGLFLSINFISITRIICNLMIKTMNITVVFSPPYAAVLYAMVSGIITGVIFGIYPALKASQMNITDSIRQA